MNVSPKVYLPTLISVLAGALLWLITGNENALLITLTGLLGGGVGAAAAPAPNVTQKEVARISANRPRR